MSPNLYLGDAAPSRTRARFNASSSASNVRPTSPSILLFLWTHEPAIIGVCLWSWFCRDGFSLADSPLEFFQVQFPIAVVVKSFHHSFHLSHIRANLYTLSKCPWEKNTFRELQNMGQILLRNDCYFPSNDQLG